MSETTLRAALRLLLSPCKAGDSVRILWHAGEPLAAGLAYFRRANDIVHDCNPRGVAITQAIQTNGTLITEEWCRFFLSATIHVGLSIDGPADLHDRHRRDRADRPSHARVMAGAEQLRRHGIPLHAIAVLTSESLEDADGVFDFFAGAGFESVGFNLEETEGMHASRLAGDEAHVRAKYRAFMSRLQERWLRAGERPRIREFEGMRAAIGAFLKDHGYTRQLDDLMPFRNIVVTRDGHLSTFSPELASGTPSDPLRFAIGNVHGTQTFEALLASPKLRELEDQINRGVARCRDECEYFPICGGGTAANKFYEHGTFDSAETKTCSLERKELAHVVADGLRRLSGRDDVPSWRGAPTALTSTDQSSRTQIPSRPGFDAG